MSARYRRRLVKWRKNIAPMTSTRPPVFPPADSASAAAQADFNRRSQEARSAQARAGDAAAQNELEERGALFRAAMDGDKPAKKSFREPLNRLPQKQKQYTAGGESAPSLPREESESVRRDDDGGAQKSSDKNDSLADEAEQTRQQALLSRPDAALPAAAAASAAQPVAAAAQADMRALVSQLSQRILLAENNGQTHMRIILPANLLPKTQVEITRNASGQMQMQFFSGDPAARDFLAMKAPDMAAAILRETGQKCKLNIGGGGDREADPDWSIVDDEA